MGGTVLTANPGGTDGVGAPTTNHRSTMADHRPKGKAVPAPAMRPYRVRAADTDSGERTERSPEETRGTRNERKPATRTGGHDPGHTAIWRGSPQFEDAVRECLDVGSQSGPSGPPGARGQRPEISRLPRLSRVGSDSVERLDCSTPDGHTTQTRQISRRTVHDAVCIQLPDGNSLWPDFATSLGGRNDRAGRSTSFDTTTGSSFWRPQPTSHR